MAYSYDVFLSYNRKYPFGDWVNDVFFKLFKAYLDEALNKDTLIFKDTLEIQNGHDWAMRIKNGLIHSRVMVSVFNPSYFRSEWCMREFALMDHRQKELGYRSLTKPSGLIVPLKLFDGEHFPSYASSIQSFDCSEFFRVGGAVTGSNMFLSFQGALQKWVYDVAEAVNNSPDWDPQWADEEWVDKPYEKITLETLPVITAPSL